MEPVPAEALPEVPPVVNIHLPFRNPEAVPVTSVRTEPLMDRDEASWFKNETVLVIGLIQGFFLSTLAMAKAFGWWHWSDMQEAIVLAETAGGFGALIAFARARVTPNSRVALEKSDVRTIEATIAKQS